VYKWFFKTANLSSFQAASIVIPSGITPLVLVVAACPISRSSDFPIRLTRTERRLYVYAEKVVFYLCTGRVEMVTDFPVAALKAGVAKEDITPPVGQRMWGFAARLSPATAILDPLHRLCHRHGCHRGGAEGAWRGARR
jgi:hypothetical protein